MNKISYLLLLISPLSFLGGIISVPKIKKSTMHAEEAPIYRVGRLKKSMLIDGDWNKSQWKKIKPIEIKHIVGKVHPFQPEVKSKMMYDQTNLYVIFQVKDRFVRSVNTEYNGPVSRDSCVEFFFSPDTDLPLRYFNLEINAGGTPLMYYITKPRSELKKLTTDELKQIQIAHSLPAKVEPEIAEPVTWTIEYRIPISLMSKYANVTQPSKGVTWKANFYKTGSNTSNPINMAWTFDHNAMNNFHRPQFFGTLVFQ